jgi:hypothetical protein
MRSRRAGLVVALAVLPLLLASGCSKPKATAPPKLIINDYVTGVQIEGETANTAVKPDQLPAGTSSGPAVTVPSGATVVNGGSLREPLVSDHDFAKVRMAIQAIAASPTGAPTTAPASGSPTSAAPTATVAPPAGPPALGYYEITLGKATSSADLVVSLAQTLPGTAFVFHYALVAADGTQGPASKQVIDAIPVGTGQIQVSVSWDVDSDVDLHVVDPANKEVYWDNPEVDSGGQLDLDSNADCDLDHKKNENITWDKAPAGTYTVRLDLFEACDTPKSNYVVTVRVIGQPVHTFSGTFTGDGDIGGEGDGKLITTFQIAGDPASASTTPQPSAT